MRHVSVRYQGLSVKFVNRKRRDKGLCHFCEAAAASPAFLFAKVWTERVLLVVPGWSKVSRSLDSDAKSSEETALCLGMCESLCQSVLCLNDLLPCLLCVILYFFKIIFEYHGFNYICILYNIIYIYNYIHTYTYIHVCLYIHIHILFYCLLMLKCGKTKHDRLMNVCFWHNCFSAWEEEKSNRTASAEQVVVHPFFAFTIILTNPRCCLDQT